MARAVHAESENYTIEIDDELDAVIHTWTGFTSGQDFRDGSNALLAAIEETGKPNLIVDTRNIQAHDDEDKAWLQEEWVPKAFDAGLTCSAMVHGESVISKMEMEGLSTELPDAPGDMFLTGDMSEAEAWVADR